MQNMRVGLIISLVILALLLLACTTEPCEDWLANRYCSILSPYGV